MARVVGLNATSYRFVEADDGSTVVSGPTTSGISSTGTLRFKASVVLPSTEGDYELQWDDGTDSWSFIEDVTVAGSEPLTTFRMDRSPWAVGTTVGLYIDANDPAGYIGQPRGRLVTSAAVASDSSLTFSDIATDTSFIAAVLVSGSWQRVRLRT